MLVAQAQPNFRSQGCPLEKAGNGTKTAAASPEMLGRRTSICCGSPAYKAHA